MNNIGLIIIFFSICIFSGIKIASAQDTTKVIVSKSLRTAVPAVAPYVHTSAGGNGTNMQTVKPTSTPSHIPPPAMPTQQPATKENNDPKQ